MIDSPKDVWFYTANGERVGPVAKDQLREMASSGQLDPRTDLCWSHGMAEWLPAGEIDGLFEKKRPEMEAGALNAAQSLPRNPQKTAKLSESELELALLDANWPGASRRVYLFTIWVMPVLVFALVGVYGHFFLDIQKPEDAQVLSIVMGIACLAIFVIVVHISLERFKNLGMSRLWFLGNFVPFLNLWVGYRSVCCPAGYEYHRKLGGIGIALAILYWGPILLFLLLIILAVISMLGLGSGMMFDEIRAYLDGLVEDAEGARNVAPPVEP